MTIAACLQRLNPAWLLLRESAVFWTGIAVIVWTHSSSLAQDILVFGAFLFALFHLERGAGAWKQPAGIAFIAVLAHYLALLPFATHPALTLRDFSRILELLAGMAAIPVVFYTRPRIQAALLYSAAAITLTLGYDIVRLAWHLGPDLLAKAHVFEPFILNHSIVASMMAGMATLVWFYFFWTRRRQPWAALACLLGMAVCLAYQVIAASRGPQIAFALTVAVSGLILPGWRRKAIWLAGMALAAAVLLNQAEHINRRLAERASMATFSSRDVVWKHTWRLAGEHPWFGHGFGKQTFTRAYYASHPPPSPFTYPHCHQFWLKLLFEFGWTGLALHLAAWLILAWQLLRHTFAQPTFEARLLPGTIGLLLLFIHLFGLGDFPDNIVQVAQYWLVPLALMLMHVEKHSAAAVP